MRNQTWKAYFYPRTKWGDKRALKVWFLIEIIVEIKIEIKKWFKLGFLDKIIKQIAFFDFYHFCEICETRVAHLIHFWGHWNTFYSFQTRFKRVQKINVFKTRLGIQRVFLHAGLENPLLFQKDRDFLRKKRPCEGDGSGAHDLFGVRGIPWIPRKKTNIGARKLFGIDLNGFPSKVGSDFNKV